MTDRVAVLSRKIKNVALSAQIFAVLGLVLLLGGIGFLFIASFLFPEIVNGVILDLIEKPELKQSFSMAQRFSMMSLILLIEMPGVIALYSSVLLFGGYRRGGIFTGKASSRLRTIGWALVAMPMVSAVVGTLMTAYLKTFIDPAKVELDLTYDESDVYAIVFGLLAVAVGHIMYEAAQLSDENRSFV
jgi:hypothetical protein